jgi:ATP-binding cassette subfamily C protein
MLIDIEKLRKNRGGSILGTIKDPFLIVPVWNRFIVVAGLFVSSVVELFGLAMIIPLLASVSAQGEGGQLRGGKAELIAEFERSLAGIGLNADISTLILLIVVGLSIKSAISIAVMRHVGDLMADITTSVRLAIVRALLDAKWQFFAAQPLGKLISAAGAEANAVGQSFFCSATLLATFLQAVAYSTIAVLISWKLALFALLVCLVMLSTFGRLVRMSKTAARQHSRQMRHMTSSLSDSIVGMKPIKAMGRQARFASLFEADARKLNQMLRIKVASSEFAGELQEPIVAALLCGGLYFATTHWQLQLHEQIVVGLLLIRLVSVFSLGQRTYQRLASMQFLYRSVAGLLDAAIAFKETYEGTIKPSLKHGVKFNGVSFGYTGVDQVLKTVDWHLPVGKISALVGLSGAGKSTVIDLIMGLRQPFRGIVRIDGIDLKDIDITGWRHMIGYVPQEVVLFNDTIHNNITLGEPEFTELDVTEALTAAGAISFVNALPKGVDSPVGERGHHLSGGQRQRIAIARALIRRPALLILDEATIGLDKKTELDICAVIQDLVRSRQITVLTISHHPAWSSIADFVFVLRDRTIILQTHPADEKGEPQQTNPADQKVVPLITGTTGGQSTGG